MSRYVTVDRKSADCKKYLSGHFSDTAVALPVPVLDGAQLSSTITFQVLNNDEVVKPNLATILFRLFRLDLISFTVLPTLIVWLLSNEQVNHMQQWVLLISVFFLHGATFAFNDYFDHMQGRDHVSEQTGSRLIQNGVLRAHQVLKAAWCLWALAFIGGIYLAYYNPGILIFAALGAALGAMGSMYQFFGLKSIGFSDIALILALGPLLTLGAQYALTESVSFPFLVMGVIYGLLALVYSQSKNLATTMLDHQAGIRTISVRLGFDKAKVFLMFELACSAILSLYIFTVNYQSVAIFVIFVAYAIYRLDNVKSPVAGLAQDYPKHILRLHYIFSFCCILLYLIQREVF
jgi:1,4-dihydroxy-2-naphthoate polyprenyltransferase